MTRKSIFLLIILLISRISFSQTEQFDDWLGEWQANYVNNMNDKQVENLTIKWAHFERWFQFDITGNVIDKPEMKWSSTMALTLDNEHNIVGWYIDNNGYDGMSTIKGVIEDNKLILKDESQISTGKQTWELKDGHLLCKGTTKSKGSGKSYTNERIFIKKN